MLSLMGYDVLAYKPGGCPCAVILPVQPEAYKLADGSIEIKGHILEEPFQILDGRGVWRELSKPCLEKLPKRLVPQSFRGYSCYRIRRKTYPNRVELLDPPPNFD